MSGRRNGRSAGFVSNASGADPHTRTDQQKRHALETWDNIKGALIGVAAVRFKDFIGDVVPGFREQFQETEARSKMTRPPQTSAIV